LELGQWDEILIGSELFALKCFLLTTFVTILYFHSEFSELKGILSKISGIDEENIQYTKVSQFSFNQFPLVRPTRHAALHENLSGALI
jgi:hypothetical protein